MDTISLPASTLEIVGRLVLATAFGALIGVNRERQGKPAGLRTHSLVSLGSAVFTLVSLLLSPDDLSSTSRVIQGITAGIGFIGAGVIMHRPNSMDVAGLTTAAGIWVVAAVGVGVGCGLWRTSLAAMALTLVVLVAGEAVDRWLHERSSSDRH